MVSEAPVTLKLEQRVALTSPMTSRRVSAIRTQPNATKRRSNAMSEALALMPWPRRVTRTETQLELSAPEWTMEWLGVRTLRLERIATRLTQRMARYGAGGATLAIDCAAASAPYPDLDDDESYSLKIDASHALLTAATEWGVLRGLATLAQLTGKRRTLPGVLIADTPRFAWRGLMVDVGPTFHLRCDAVAHARRDGAGETQRAASAPDRRSGLPLRQSRLSRTGSARERRRLLHGRRPRRRRLARGGTRHSRRSRTRHARPHDQLARRTSRVGTDAGSTLLSRRSSVRTARASIRRATKSTRAGCACWTTWCACSRIASCTSAATR